MSHRTFPKPTEYVLSITSHEAGMSLAEDRLVTTASISKSRMISNVPSIANKLQDSYLPVLPTEVIF